MPGADKPLLHVFKQALVGSADMLWTAELEQGATPGADRPRLDVFKQALVDSADMLWTCSRGSRTGALGPTDAMRRCCVCFCQFPGLEVGCRPCQWIAARHTKSSVDMPPLHKPPAWSCTAGQQLLPHL